MNYPDDMDAECVVLCDALNSLIGIDTIESCCGHGTRPHRIFFTAKWVEDLRPILEKIDDTAWFVQCGWASGSDTLYFFLEGPIGPSDIPGGANDLARML